MEKPNVYISKTFIETDNPISSEIDFTFYNAFSFDYETHNDLVTIDTNKESGYIDAHPVLIDSLIEVLNDLKSKGANYAKLEYHSDHIGYEISGYNIRLSTPEEIEAYENKINGNKQVQRQQAIKALEQEIQKLKQK